MLTAAQIERLNKIIDLTENNKDVRTLIDEILCLDINEKRAKETKFNFYDFASKDAYKECMEGVFHTNGWMVASNSHILIASKENYDEKNEGKVLRKDGSEIDTTETSRRYPKWEVIKPSFKETASYKIDFSKLEEWMKLYKAHQKLMTTRERKRHIEYMKIGNNYYNLKLFYTFAKGVKYLGSDSIIQSIGEDGEKKVGYVDTEKGWAVIMPIMNPNKGITNKEEQYNVYEF